MMNDLRITEKESGLLRELINCESVAIVWDLNAFYFNTKTTTYKLECLADLPEGAASEYDEIVFCRFQKLKQMVVFRESEAGFWYKIVTKATKVHEVKIVDIVQVFPQEALIDRVDITKYESGLNGLSLGCVIRTNEGSLPAFTLPSNFGFDWAEKYAFYSEGEVADILQTEIKKFELRPI
jgi:hypothetical protein